MKKKLLMSAFCAVVLGTSGYVGYKSMPKDVGSDLLLANVEALARRELDCNYIRNERTCTIKVGAKGSIKLFTGTILTADANGEITFDGQVSCSSGGNTTCTPVDCKDLYEIIL